MSGRIVAKKVIVLHQNGYRTDYTHVTKFEVYNPLPRNNREEPKLIIHGETDDTFGMRQNVMDRLPIKDLHMTIIDWHISPE